MDGQGIPINGHAGESSGTGSSKEPAPQPQSRKHRKLNRSQPQLKRNAACLPCRRRRIKCDAGKPHCSSCTRSFQFLQRTNPDAERDRHGIQCFYEDDEDELAEGGEVERRDDPKVAVKKLEARVEELQKALLETPTPGPGVSAQQPIDPSWSSAQQHPIDPRASYSMLSNSTHSSYSAPNEYPAALPHSSSSTSTHNGLPAPPLTSTQQSQPLLQDMQGDLLGDGRPTAGIDGEAGKLGGQFVDLIWPGWPPRLPTPAMLDHLVQVFFNMVPSISRLIHRQTFTARLLLRPTHQDFPHTALLHAICAVAARYSAAVKTCSVEDSIARSDAKSWETDRPGPGGLSVEEKIGMEECFGERNMRYAQLECKLESVHGRKLVDMVQAMALITYYCQQHANWIGGWMTIAQSVRASIPLGLMRNVPNPKIADTWKPGHSLLPPPVDDWDREERRTLMFTILMFDIGASSSSGWPNMIMVDELYTRLPCSRAEFERGGEMTENPQTVLSPDLFTNHPVEDSFVALIKGGIILNRVNKFVRFVKAADPSDRAAMKASPEFKKLDDDIATFVRHFPPALRDPLKPLTGMHKGIDADLISAHLVPHVAAITLHEPFADLTDPKCTCAIRLSTESRACLGTIHLVTSTSLDLSYTLVPITSCNYCFTAARTLLLFYQRAIELREMASAKVLLSELEILKLAFKALGNRFAMGRRHWGMLQSMLDRINKENGFAPSQSPLDQAVPAEPNMHARAFPIEHPDSILSQNPTQNSEPFRDVMDRRRGFISKSASIHSASPAKSSPTAPLSDFAAPPTVHDQAQPQPQPQTNAQAQGQGQGIFTSSPLPPPVTEIFPPNLNPVQMLGQDIVVPDKPPAAAFDHISFSQANFNFTTGQNGWNGLGSANIIEPISHPPPPIVPDFGIAHHLAPTPTPTVDMGFDWINWLSTANVTMMASEEQGMGSM